MGISLNGLTPAGTYPGLIKTGDNTAISGTPKVLSDGNGNNLPMEVSTTGVNFTNQLQQGGVAVPTASQVAAKQDTLVSGTNIKTINGASLLGSGNIPVVTSPSGVSGAIQFSDGSAFASDAANFFWNNTTKRLGVGTNTPTGKTQITESFTTIANNYSAITFDGTITSRATASDTIFGFRNTQSIVATALSQTIIANDLSPNYTFFDANTDSIALKIGGLKNSQNNISAILMQQTAGAGNNGLAIQPANNRWQMGFISGQGNSLGSNPRVVFGNSGIRIATSSTPANNLFEIIGTGSTSATTSLLVQNSAGSTAFRITDDLVSTFFGARTSITSTICQIQSSAYLSIQAGGSDIFIGSTTARFSNKIIVGNAASDAVASAQFQIDSTTCGFLPPRMTTTQINAIASPANGLEVYNTTLACPCFYDGTAWRKVSHTTM
jgi:hypothetical protein